MNRFGSGLILIVLFSLVLGSAQYAAAGGGAPLQDGDLIATTRAGLLEVFRPSGALVQTIQGVGSSVFTFQLGMCWNQSQTQLLVSDDRPGGDEFLSVFSFDPVSTNTQPFASGLQGALDCVVDASGNFYVTRGPTLTLEGPAGVDYYAPDGTLLDSIDFVLGSLSGLDLAADNCTMFYPARVIGNLDIKRHDVCTDTTLPDFATLPAISTNTRCGNVEIRPNGEVLVNCGDIFYRMSPAGAILQSYPISSFNPAPPGNTGLLLLDPDDLSFWTGLSGTGRIYRIDFANGNTINSFVIPTNLQNDPGIPGGLGGNVGDLEIFNTETPPPEQCPPGTVGTPPDCIPIIGNGPVGGEMIPLDTTMVLAAGAQYTAAWMIPVIVSGIGFAIVIARKF